jgi:hypothetical protein
MIRALPLAAHRLVAAFFVLASVAQVEAAQFTLQQNDGGVTVRVDGQLFTEYRTNIGTKPILWPIIGPDGAQMTRDYPMKDVVGEKHDHFHQRSLWFTYGEVNGIDFWAEPGSYKDGKAPTGKRLGTIVHRDFQKLDASGDSATIVTTNDWLDEAGTKQLEDERRLRFILDGESRAIDFDITLKATAGDVEFGDTKEGAMGTRVPTSMDVTSKLGGAIMNSEGQADEQAWGKPARWVDYHGPVGEQTVGIAVMNHPSSFHYPSRWHVRTYGLFAANPFGLRDFDKQSASPGGYTLRSGESIALRYRFIFHRGDEKSAQIAAAFDRYAAQQK